MSNVGWIETSRKAVDHSRVYWINFRGDIADLPPVGTPPIIKGIANDPQRILVDYDGNGVQDIMPEVIGLTA